MTQDQEKFLKELYNRLEPSEPLERLSVLYEPVYEAYADDTGYMSPVRSLMKRIQFGGA